MKYLVMATTGLVLVIAGLFSVGTAMSYTILGSQTHSGDYALNGLGFWFIGVMTILLGVILLVAGLLSYTKQGK